jgi:hypothetical protein
MEKQPGCEDLNREDPMQPTPRTAAFVALLLGGIVAGAALGAPPVERTEEREPCADSDPLRRPLFGDLHVHTRYSFDSYTSGQRNDPWGAYRYAKGEPIPLPGTDDEQSVTARIRRPLDFLGVTDHAEYLGEINLCTQDAWQPAYWAPICILTRTNNFFLALVGASMWVELGVMDDSKQKSRSIICSLPGKSCPEGEGEFWGEIQRAAEEHYDRSAACSFTTFVAYEYTDAPNFKNLHRNVIFRNERVTTRPFNTYDTGAYNVPELWRLLRSGCIERDDGCDVLSIPHNSNLSGGLMFPDPANEAEAVDRSFFEPVVELVQHKSASECRYDRLLGRGTDTEDELCTFEQNRNDTLASLGHFQGEMRAEGGEPVALDDFARRNMVRNVLKDGLALEQQKGRNPFKLGFIGSTDTHSAIAGGTMEDDYPGHLGKRDAGYRNVQDHFEDNPGGLAVVWAEENSRDAIFEGIRRKETYATSGTRPVVRVFGGFGLDPGLCQSPDRVRRGYAAGVPMGGDLEVANASGAPRFLVDARKDPGTSSHPGTDLQRLQMVKGWLDAQGGTHERVFEIAGGRNSASVDPDACAPTGSGHTSLCSVWQDPSFDPSQRAFYYVRVLENPTCRWSTHQCQAAGVNPFSDSCQEQAAKANAAAEEAGAPSEVWRNCCLEPEEQPFYERVIQERAWTSPIWYSPAGT